MRKISAFCGITRALVMLALVLCTSLVSYAQPSTQVDWRSKGTSSDVNFYDLQRSFNTYWQGNTNRKGQGYKTFKRWENFVAPRVYPSGNMALPSTTYANFQAWQQQNNAGKNAAIATTGNWTSFAAGMVPSGYDAGAGRINFIRFDPTDTNIMYVSSPDGGLWKSTNGGISWSTNTDFLPVIGCTDLAINPNNTQVMYLATGDKETDRRSIGVLKSTDGGTTWNSTSLVWTAIDNYRTTRLLMDPTDPNTMMVATDGGIFRTTDGWATNMQVSSDLTEDMEYKPGDPATVYASGTEFFKSTDGGDTWNVVTSGLPLGTDVSRMVLGVTAGNAGYVYAIAGDVDGGFNGFYRSTNSGSSFTEMSASPNILHANAAPGPGDTGGQAFHDLAIAVSPTNADLVTIGGINQWQSTDGGANWARITYWLGVNPSYPGYEAEPEPYIHADIQNIEYLPGSSTTFFTSCDGGISKTTDNGVSWTDITNDLTVSQMTAIAVSATTEDLQIAGLQDIGTLKYDAGAWSVIGGGDGEDCFIDRTNDLNMVYCTVNAQFYLSTDGGINYDPIAGVPTGGEWFSPIHQDPVVATRVYLGGFPNLYVSNDVFTGSATWTQLGAPLGSGNILKFAIAPSNNSIIYAIQADAISKSTDAGLTWSNVTGTLPTTVALTNLTISDTDPDKVWVVFSGYSIGDKAFQSVDGGTSWTNLSAGLPNLPINAIVYSNGSAIDAIYLAADIGVYYYDNTLSAWAPYFTDLPNCAVIDLEIFYPTGKLRAATYGRGAWESDLYSPLIAVTPSEVNRIKVYPNPVADRLTIEISGATANVPFEIINGNGQVLRRGELMNKTTVQIGDFAAGVYTVRFGNNKTLQFEKIVKQ